MSEDAASDGRTGVGAVQTSPMRQVFTEMAAASIDHDLGCEQARRRAYLAYMASPAWRENPARLAELEAAQNRCRLCNRAPPMVRLEVHHRTYKNLGCERVEDLATLCSTCHGMVTAMLRDRLSTKGIRRL